MGGGIFKAVKKFSKVAEGLGDAGKLARRGEHIAEAAQDAAKLDNVGEAATAASRLPDDALVVRGGLNKPENLKDALLKGGISAQSAPGKTVDELASFVPHKKIGVTTVGEIRRAGGDVIQTPGPGFHATIIPGPGGVEDISGLLRPPRPNPAMFRPYVPP